MEVSWPVLAGKTYELQRSCNLEDWETIHVVTPSRDGRESFLDHENSKYPPPRMFYRVVQSQSSLLLLAMGVPRRRRKQPAVSANQYWRR
jgi:hypothetical protein